MRIEKIRIQNLNSLYGTHEVDLTADVFRKNNLFLIWGATGSGKTTILDGITLALYGRTSRLDKVTKSENGIMSQGTRNCSAEVTFSLGGARYRASWSQEVNRNGNLKEYKRELCKVSEVSSELDTVIETRLSAMDEAIQSLIKLSYEQFTKAVLLEQGKFSEFLSAKDDDRAKILEQLTGTDIYTKLSKAAYERASEEENKCKLARQAVEGVELLSDEKVAQLVADKAKYETDVCALKADIERLNAELNWLEKETAAAKRVADIEAERVAHDRDAAEFEPKRSVLEKGERAAQIGHVYDHHVQNNKELQKEAEVLEKMQASLPEVKATQAECGNLVTATKTALESAHKAREESQPLFDKVRELQTELKAKRHELKELSEKLSQLEADYARNESVLNETKAEAALLEQRLSKADEYFRDHAINEQLLADYPVIDERRKQLVAGDDEIQKADLALKKAQKDQVKAEKDLAAGLKKVDEARLAQEEDKLKADAFCKAYEDALDGHSLVDLEEIKDGLLREKSAAQIIADYASKRLELEDGKPCPLCGAISHPYCEHETPQVSAVDQKINSLETQIRAIRKAKEAMETSVDCARKSQMVLDMLCESVKTLQNVAEMSQKSCAEKSDILHDCQAHQASLFVGFNQLIEKYEESAADIALAEKVCERLAKRHNEWKRALPLREELKEAFAKKQTDVQTLQARSEEIHKHIDKQKSDVSVKENQVNDKLEEIRTLFGDRNVDAEENELKQAEMLSEQRYQKASERLTHAISEYSKLESGIAVRQKTVENWQQTVNDSKNTLEEALKKQNFEDVAAFCDARLAESDLKALRSQADHLDKTGNDIRSRAAEAGKVLSELRQHPLTTRERPALEAEKQEKDAHLQELTKNIGIIIQTLEAQNKDREKMNALREALGRAEAEFSRWSALKKLIGQGDGAKFRKFAQGVTFNALLRNANRYLQEKKLMPRFELVRKNSDDQSLGFMVMDYQTGRPRTAQNLSGGEKFCMSLSLALALSEMASNNVAIESLFIDEGLGTLDDQTLDTALTMLQNLGDARRERLVGLITHVDRARETIMTHITVEKLGNGRSTIHGPGCQMVKAIQPDAESSKRGRKPKNSQDA